MQDHTKLVVWQRARSLTVAINEACRAIRRGDAPGLRAQLMRAAMSISSTIAEGAGRDTRPDFARFVSMAISSASEVEHHLTVCGDLGVIDSVIAERLIDRVVDIRKMLFGLRRALIDKDVQERAVRGPTGVQRTQD
ncbi:MAG: four helix bundle protein [Gemmatimonadales bacterium]